MKINRKTKMSEILESNPNAVEILFNEGLSCVGCHMTMSETLEEGCKSHGMTDKQINELVKKLNKEKFARP